MPRIEPISISGGITCPHCEGSGCDPDIHTFLPPRPHCPLCGGLGRVTAHENEAGEWVLERIAADPVGKLLGADSARLTLVHYDPARHEKSRVRYRAESAL
jgi:hypothetical protein